MSAVVQLRVRQTGPLISGINPSFPRDPHEPTCSKWPFLPLLFGSGLISGHEHDGGARKRPMGAASQYEPQNSSDWQQQPTSSRAFLHLVETQLRSKCLFFSTSYRLR